MKKTVYFLIVLLAVLHQDFWLWDNAGLIFGFLPVGLAYHALYSILCGVLWALVIKFAWPSDLDPLDGADRPAEMGETQC